MDYVAAVRMGEHVMLIMKEDLFVEQLLSTLRDRQGEDHEAGVEDDDQRHYAIDDIILALERPIEIGKNGSDAE